jgi:RluA family pseudouridine synthase
MKESILFEDDDLIAVNKAAGELVVADRFGIEADDNILLRKLGAYLRTKGAKADEEGRDLFPVHRLDRDTSGIVVFAKNSDMHRALSRIFEERQAQKIYWAFCSGIPDWDWCEISLPLQRGEGKKGRGRALVHIRNGGEAITEFRLIERFGDISWLEATPATGRLHQIRVHARILGHALLCDRQYADLEWKSEFYPKLEVSRIPLHARKLSFTHPLTKQQIDIVCPVDDSMRGLLNELKQRRP